MKIKTYPIKEKQQEMLKLLQFGTVMAFIDSRHPDVKVPQDHRENFQLRLNFDYAFEIEDFRILPDRVEATLSFPNEDFFCVVPFEAIYLMVNHSIQNGSLFVESVPSEMLQVFAGSIQAESETSQEEKAASPFQVIENSDQDAQESNTSPKKTIKKGHLKLVK